ncbi:MAG: HhoA/HhoB/HtrA family serine endopeptidase [Xenococcaceae cyanobacterium]
MSNSNPSAFQSLLQKTATYLSLVLLGVGITLGGQYLATKGQLPSPEPDSSALPAHTPTSQVPPSPSAATGNTNFVVAVVEKVGGAVVKIEVFRTVSNNFDYYFRKPPEREQQGTGSGFIISADGLILTNAHLVGGTDKKVRVKLRDGRSFEGQVVGADPVTDVAVVKIEADNLPTVTLGNSDQLQTGEWAIAIGNPLGLDNTVTTGIISATGRSSHEIGVPDYRVEFIQTDAAINPGNSGGPLLNTQGEVIGINTAIIQNAQGIGFAIPINRAQHVADQLIAHGRFEHPFLGIEMVTLTPQIKQEIISSSKAPIRIDEEDGVLIVRVLPRSPAARTGLRAGDVLKKINNQPVTEALEVQKIVADSQVGSDLNLELKRNSQTLNLTAQVGALPQAQGRRK